MGHEVHFTPAASLLPCGHLLPSRPHEVTIPRKVAERLWIKQTLCSCQWRLPWYSPSLLHYPHVPSYLGDFSTRPQNCPHFHSLGCISGHWQKGQARRHSGTPAPIPTWARPCFASATSVFLAPMEPSGRARSGCRRQIPHSRDRLHLEPEFSEDHGSPLGFSAFFFIFFNDWLFSFSKPSSHLLLDKVSD